MKRKYSNNSADSSNYFLANEWGLEMRSSSNDQTSTSHLYVTGCDGDLDNVMISPLMKDNKRNEVPSSQSKIHLKGSTENNTVGIIELHSLKKNSTREIPLTNYS